MPSHREGLCTTKIAITGDLGFTKYYKDACTREDLLSQDSYTWDYLPLYIDRTDGKITKGECPVIFTNTDAKNYKLLWPLSANDVYQNERVKFAYLYDKNKTFNKFQWMMWEIRRCRVKRGRDVIRGRILYYLGLWKRCDRKLIEYIKHPKKK